MRWRIPLVVSLALFVAVSCDQQPVEPESADSAMFDPATVEHTYTYEWPGRATWMDNDPDTEDWDVFLLGYDPADDFVCNDGVNVGGVPFRHFSVYKYNEKADSFREIYVGQMVGRQPIYLYTRASFPQTGDFAVWCDYLKNDWLAAGSWHMQVTDNDVSGVDATPGMNSFGQVETGQLVDRDGNRYKYAWKYHCNLNPDGDPVIRCRSGVDRVTRIGQH